MQKQLKQVSPLDRVRCALCEKEVNLSAYGLDDKGNVCIMCLECFEKSGTWED